MGGNANRGAIVHAMKTVDLPGNKGVKMDGAPVSV